MQSCFIFRVLKSGNALAGIGEPADRRTKGHSSMYRTPGEGITAAASSSSWQTLGNGAWEAVGTAGLDDDEASSDDIEGEAPSPKVKRDMNDTFNEEELIRAFKSFDSNGNGCGLNYFETYIKDATYSHDVVPNMEPLEERKKRTGRLTLEEFRNLFRACANG